MRERELAANARCNAGSGNILLKTSMFNSISSKMIAATSALVVICSGSFLLLSMKEHESVYRRTVIDHLDALAGNLADDLVPLLGEHPDTLAMATKLLDFERYANVKYAVIYDSNWRILQHYVAPEFMPHGGSRQSLPPFNIKTVDLGVSIRDGDLISYNTIGDLAYLQGYLLVVNSYRTPLNTSNYDLIVSSMPVALAILLVMVILAILFNRRLLSPISRLAKFADSIETSSNYHLRYDCQGDDEVADLGRNVNAMLTRIEKQNAQSLEYTAALERQQEALEKLANYDPLTELPNRKFFMEVLQIELSKAKRHSTNLMVLFLDLDDFKGINDSLGHEAGDAMLIKVGELIRNQLRGGDVLARLGGDEFLVLLSYVRGDIPELAITIAERIIRVLELPIIVLDWEVQTGVSIGIADARSSDFEAEAIVRNADIAMYHAKESGRNTYALFQQQLQANSMRKMLIANALTKALLENEFEVVYQAKVGRDGGVIGLEALIRWQSSFDGMISPGEFIPVAEHSGKITAISRWVLQRVFKDLPRVFQFVGPQATVSINLSAQDIKDIRFLDFIKSQLTDHSVDSTFIEFEITESSYLDNFEDADKFIRELRELGFSIALDDFGAGYSSMGYLTRIEIDTLKIDQQFVKRLGDSSRDRLIIEAIIGLAHNLELNVCAEGVENARQKDFLIQHGCQQLQGYYYCKPCAISDLPAVVTEINHRQHPTMAKVASTPST